MNKRRGNQSIQYANPPAIISTGNIGGPMEGASFQGEYLDTVMKDNINGFDSWEQCESYMLEQAVKNAAKKIQMTEADLEFIFAGDLLNQLMSTHFALRTLARPFLGLYGACSTMVESMIIGAAFIDGGFADIVAGAASSHHDAAERQYRFPTELGVQRPPVAQWTVTGSGAAIIAKEGQGPKITCATVGKIVDMGLKDPNSLGPAMAPAAADTILAHFKDFGKKPEEYDMIFTGDLGSVGKAITTKLCSEQGLNIGGNYQDCGCMIYREDQDAHAGASGCASSAVVFSGYIYKMLLEGTFKKVLLVGTGSLHSPTSYQQKESIPCIAHAVSIEM